MPRLRIFLSLFDLCGVSPSRAQKSCVNDLTPIMLRLLLWRTLEKMSSFSTEYAQKRECGESQECLCIFSVVSIRLCTKYHRKQAQNLRTLVRTEFLAIFYLHHGLPPPLRSASGALWTVPKLVGLGSWVGQVCSARRLPHASWSRGC